MKSWRLFNWDAAWNESLFPVINISGEEMKDVMGFASKQTDNYGARGQNNEKNKIKQKSWGKMGELVTYHTLRLESFYPNSLSDRLTYPDFKIYGDVDKTWDVDITSGRDRFLVKSCGSSSACRQKCSWVLQFSDDGGRGTDKEIFEYKSSDGNKVFSFVLVDFEERMGRVACFCHLSVIRRYRLHLGIPIAKSLRWSKRIVYYEKLVKRLDLDNPEKRSRII